MTQVFLLFGSQVDDLQELKRQIERALEVALRLHESGCMGGDYYRARTIYGEEVVLRRNVDQSRPEPEPMYEEFVAYPTILEINATTRASDIRDKLAALPTSSSSK